jgi:hypothetical protein
MTTIKVINDTDVGTTLDISSGKLEVAASMATDAELADAIAAQDVLKDAAEETTRLRNAFIKRAQQVLSSESIFEVSPAGFKFYLDPAMYVSRLLVIGAGEGAHSLEGGYLNIYPPVTGDVIKGLGIPDTIVDVNGFIPIPHHGTLYFKLPAPNSPDNAVGEWYVSEYDVNDYDVPDDFLFICQQLPDSPGGMCKLFDGRKLTQGKNYPDTNWILLAPYYAANVSDYGNGHQLPRFRRLNNRVYVEGLASIATLTSKTIWVLPDGFRPLLRHLFPTDQRGGAPARVDVLSDGQIYQSTAASQPWLSLEFNFGLA